MTRQALVVGAIAMALVASLTAKGPTVRLVITGGTLATPVTVTDPSVLPASNVFGGAFLGSIADAQSINPAWPKYEVSFFVEPPAWMNQGVKKMYVVRYVKHPQTGEGFVYLPAAGDEWYRLNVSTIMRGGLEGNWLHASEPWAKALNTYLP